MASRDPSSDSAYGLSWSCPPALRLVARQEACHLGRESRRARRSVHSCLSADARTVVSQHDDPVHNGMMVAACNGPPSTWVARKAMKKKTNSPDAMSGRP